MTKVQIDENLRRIFDEDASEELPPQLQELLSKLDGVAIPKALRTDKSGGDA